MAKWISMQVVHYGSLNDVVVTVVVDAIATAVLKLKRNGKDVNSIYRSKKGSIVENTFGFAKPSSLYRT